MLRSPMSLSVPFALTAMVIVVLAVVLTVMPMSMPGGQGVADPILDDARDGEVVRTQHHHVGGAVESRGVQAVQFDVLRLGTAHAGRPPSIDRYSPARTRCRLRNRAVGAHRSEEHTSELQSPY